MKCEGCGKITPDGDLKAAGGNYRALSDAREFGWANTYGRDNNRDAPSYYRTSKGTRALEAHRKLTTPKLSEILTEADGTEYQLVDGWLFRRLPGASGWVPAYGYPDHAKRKGALKKRRIGD